MAILRKVRGIFEILSTKKVFDQVLKKVKILVADPGKVVAEFTVEEEHQNPGGTLHGGFTATLIDSMTTLALLSGEDGRSGVSVDLNVTYLGAAKTGDLVTITAEALKVGRTLAFTTAELKLSDGKLVARGNHTKHLS
ncbi:acyl-coenzyme A thioesterase 13-like isoform X3 [Xenia sp. Carnegie-2017]|uniref:acyl-coenzyme A thioesterase 13-like isoform X3 n=1 Tax=Xenia sp. Carnegie-2017 TaxID=2897299 RepID=UPI001F04E8CE|nr:acyl-coenzyme A thioesterase 13-like isoform X3 [Xenia sp. Carnegie-2017]